MPKYKLDTSSIKHYTVVIEADSIEEAEAEVREWIADDFEEYQTGAEWADGEWEEVEETNIYKIGRPFKGYEYTEVEATNFTEALELASAFWQGWVYNPETHELIEDGNQVIWIRNLDTLEDRTY